MEAVPISYTALPLLRSEVTRWTSVADGRGEVTWCPT